MRTVTPTVTATAMIVASGLSTTANLVKIGLTAADNFDGGRAAGGGERITVFRILDAVGRVL